ncbi:hypothetical protein [Draconibacterium halophilum]|uniref:Uncharacterized protein n=1 Tax=Draconibacterium halophilum TaxID=2706887 RepID=A0A6C0RDB8_9BACT|nr:hypothetical protein [Draconibacterium halophilum]QIA07131.1 hypothetical protein G0Q07_05030 [Draconibacterium halophilum]
MVKSNVPKPISLIVIITLIAITSSAQTYTYDIIRETKMNNAGTQQIGNYEDYGSNTEISFRGIDVTIKIDGEIFVVGREMYGSNIDKEETEVVKKISKYYFPLGKEHADKTNFHLTEYYDKVNKRKSHILSYEVNKRTTNVAGAKFTSSEQRVLMFINSKEFNN